MMNEEKIITYDVADEPLILLGEMRISGIKRDSKENRDFLKNLNKRFFEEKEDRITQIDKVLNFYGLPTKVFDLEALDIIDEWVRANIEHNNVPLENDEIRMNSNLKYARTKIKPDDSEYPEVREATQLWKSYLFDIGIKMGEEAIQQYPNLRWDMFSKYRGTAFLNSMLITGLTHERFKGDFIHLLNLTTDYYLSDVIRNHTPFSGENCLVFAYNRLTNEA